MPNKNLPSSVPYPLILLLTHSLPIPAITDPDETKKRTLYCVHTNSANLLYQMIQKQALLFPISLLVINIWYLLL